MKAITAAVIAILNVNIRFRLPARCSSGAKKDRGATAEGPLVADRLWDSQRREGQLRAVRSAFEPADFGQIAALKTGLETELRDIRTKFAEGDRVPAMQFWQKHRRRPSTCSSSPWSDCGPRKRGSAQIRNSGLTFASVDASNCGAMELRSLHYFVRIAELGSITRASAHLHVAQPALTRHVQRLEEELDITLFTRVNRGVRLTEGGQKLLESAQRIPRDVERAGDEIRAHKAHPSGKVALAVTPTLCPVVVPELFDRMP